MYPKFLHLTFKSSTKLFILSDDANIMDRAVNPAGLENLSLAQVVSVSAHSASLRQLAGPQRAQADLRNLIAVHL